MLPSVVDAVVTAPEGEKTERLVAALAHMELGRGKKCLKALREHSANQKSPEASATLAFEASIACTDIPCIPLIEDWKRRQSEPEAWWNDFIACTDANGPDILFTGSLARERTEFKDPLGYLILKFSLDALSSRMEGDTEALAVWQRMEAVAPLIAAEMKPATSGIPSAPHNRPCRVVQRSEKGLQRWLTLNYEDGRLTHKHDVAPEKFASAITEDVIFRAVDEMRFGEWNTHYRYDEQGRLLTVGEMVPLDHTGHQHEQTKMSKPKGLKVVAQPPPGGSVLTFNYNSEGRVSGWEDKQFSWTVKNWDANGRPLEVTSTIGTMRTSMSYQFGAAPPAVEIPSVIWADDPYFGQSTASISFNGKPPKKAGFYNVGSDGRLKSGGVSTFTEFEVFYNQKDCDIDSPPSL
jgi:hypothetical protein